MKKLLFVALMFATSLLMAQAPNGANPKQKQKKSPEERATAISNHLTTQLGLSESQKKQVYSLVLEKSAKVKSIREQYGADKKLAHEKIQPIRKEFNDKMKTILTADQYTKWEKMKAERRAKHEARKKEMQLQNKTAPTPAPEVLDDID